MPDQEHSPENLPSLRALGELPPGTVAFIGSGLPSGVPALAPDESHVQFLTETGLLGGMSGSDASNGLGLASSNGLTVGLRPGGSVSSTVDVAAMLRGGHVDAAIIEPSQVDPQGNFTHWTTRASDALHAPGFAVDAASGAGRTIALMPHTNPDGSPRIVGELSGPPDGLDCIDLIITERAVIRVSPSGLILEELAPGWSAGEVISSTGAPLEVAGTLREMTPSISTSLPVNKLCDTGLAAVSDVPNGAVVMIDGFAGPGRNAPLPADFPPRPRRQGTHHHQQHRRHRPCRQLRHPARQAGHRSHHPHRQSAGPEGRRLLSRLPLRFPPHRLRDGLPPR